MSDSLEWPLEATCPSAPEQRWSQPASNICLDFHGDPVTAGLVVFSDGNHHMALEASLQAFCQQYPEVVDIFYATTPPSVIVNLLKNGQIVLGNLSLSRQPHVFVSPPEIMNKLQNDGYVASHQVFMQSRSNVLLVRKSNPKNIQSVDDILRDDVHLFISNPVTEKASYEVYAETLQSMARPENTKAIKEMLEEPSTRVIFGKRIHHREAPQSLYEGKADVAMVYHHLALRYSRIFPDEFQFVSLEEDSEKNITTNYHIGQVGDGSKWGKQFLDYMFSDTVTQLYAEHGLQRPK